MNQLFIGIVIISIFANPLIYGIEKKDIMKIACRRNPLLSFCQTSPSPDIINNNNNNTRQTTKSHEGQNDSNNTAAAAVLTSTEDISLSLLTTTTSSIHSSSSSEINLHKIMTLDDEVVPTKVVDNKTNEEVSEASSKEVGWKFSTLIDGNTGTNTKSETKKNQKVFAIDDEVDDGSRKINNNDNRHSGSNDDSGFGSLLRLPKPALGHGNKKEENHSITNTTSSSSSSRNETTSPSSMLVFVTKYCVDQRISFKKNCLGKNINNENMDLCKNYPLACQGKEQIMPVMYYCDKFEFDYDKLCHKKDVIELGKVNDIIKVVNFCSAYPTICIDSPLEHDPIIIKSPPKSNFVRCEDIKEKARKLCNPFPSESDILNHVKCSQFLKTCKDFVDWV